MQWPTRLYKWRQRSVEAVAPSTALRAVPLPRTCVRGRITNHAASVSFTAATSCFSVNGLGRKPYDLVAIGQMLLERVLGIAGDEDDLQVGIAGAQLVRRASGRPSPA